MGFPVKHWYYAVTYEARSGSEGGRSKRPTRHLPKEVDTASSRQSPQVFRTKLSNSYKHIPNCMNDPIRVCWIFGFSTGWILSLSFKVTLPSRCQDSVPTLWSPLRRTRNHRELSLISQANHTMPVVQFKGGSLLMGIMLSWNLLAFAEDLGFFVGFQYLV